MIFNTKILVYVAGCVVSYLFILYIHDELASSDQSANSRNNYMDFFLRIVMSPSIYL